MKLIACGSCGHSLTSDSVRCPKCGQGYPGLRAECPSCSGNHVLVKRLNAAPNVIGREGREPLPPIATMLKAADLRQLEFLCRSCAHLWRPANHEVKAAFEQAVVVVQEEVLEQTGQANEPRNWLDRIKEQTLSKFASN